MLLKREGEWERRKEKNQLWDAGKLKNRKITFLVQADRTYLLHFFSLSTIFLLHEIWCWNVCSSSFQLLLSVLTLLSQKISFILHVTLCAPTFYSLSLSQRVIFFQITFYDYCAQNGLTLNSYLFSHNFKVNKKKHTNLLWWCHCSRKFEIWNFLKRYDEQ